MSLATLLLSICSMGNEYWKRFRYFCMEKPVILTNYIAFSLLLQMPFEKLQVKYLMNVCVCECEALNTLSLSASSGTCGAMSPSITACRCVKY